MKIPRNLEAWVLTHLAAFMMLGTLALDTESHKSILSISGYFAAIFLVVTLSLTPLKLVRPNWYLVTKVNRFRRELGISAFSYSVVHILCFAVKKGSVSSALPYLFHPAVITASLIAVPILFILTVSSNKCSVKILGFKRWKDLHRKVYWAEGAIIAHMMLVGQSIWALTIFGPLLAIQLIRLRRENKKTVKEETESPYALAKPHKYPVFVREL